MLCTNDNNSNGRFFFFFRKERYNLERPMHNVIRGTLRLIATRGEHCSAIGLVNSLFLEKFKNEFESRTDKDYVRPVRYITYIFTRTIIKYVF